MEKQNKANNLVTMDQRNPELTNDVTDTKGLKWEDFDLKKMLISQIIKKGFSYPSPVQEEAIPVILSEKNLIVRAKNGTGKTAAFLIPIINMIDLENPNIQCLVLVPTRELALQISGIIKELGKLLNIESVICTGGTSLKEDIMRLKKKVHIIVGTPGRILDLSEKKICNLKYCKRIVLDEADKLISSDFLPVIQNLIKMTPKDNQTILFSATFPSSISNFIKDIPNIQKINLMKELTLSGITQYYCLLNEKQKLNVLFQLFNKLKMNQVIIFCSSAIRVELLAKKISKIGIPCYYVHSKMKQDIRNKVFHNFKSGKGKCLVSTDLFTRGIDIPTINIVFNFDFPETSETYLHRVGRSGRFGHLGLAINFITENDKSEFTKIENELKCSIKPIPSDIDENIY